MTHGSLITNAAVSACGMQRWPWKLVSATRCAVRGTLHTYTYGGPVSLIKLVSRQKLHHILQTACAIRLLSCTCTCLHCVPAVRLKHHLTLVWSTGLWEREREGGRRKERRGDRSEERGDKREKREEIWKWEERGQRTGAIEGTEKRGDSEDES